MGARLFGCIDFCLGLREEYTLYWNHVTVGDTKDKHFLIFTNKGRYFVGLCHGEKVSKFTYRFNSAEAAARFVENNMRMLIDS